MILFEKFPEKSNIITGQLLDRSKNKFCRWRGLRKKMPLELAAASRPRPSTGLDAESPVHFSEICLTWFIAESGLRIEIWTRQYIEIVQNFDPRLMELALEGPDITEKTKNDNIF